MKPTEAIRRQFYAREHSKQHGVKINEIRELRAAKAQGLFSKTVIVRRVTV